MDAAASFWPLPIPWTPALTFSAINVADYKVKARGYYMSSGGIPSPPS